MYIHAATELTFADHREAIAHLFRTTQPNGKALDPDSPTIAAQLESNGYFLYVSPTVQPWQELGALVVGSPYTHAVLDRAVEVELRAAIDLAADSARARLISPGTYVCEEYALAFEDATKYAAAGYTGDVPGGVLTWAQAQEWTNEAAANDIIYQKAAWKYASDQIRALRLQGKADVATASTSAAKWAAGQSFIAQINALFT